MQPSRRIDARIEGLESPPAPPPDRDAVLRRYLRFGALAAVAAFGVGMVEASAAQADTPGSLTMGPQGMEGDLKVMPGTALRVGYDFTIPGKHPSASVTFASPQVVFSATCVSGGGGGSFAVEMPTATYTDPQGSSAWYPSGDQHDDAVYQGELAVPDLCNGGQVRLAQGGTFKTIVTSDVTVKGVNVRWHYSANGTSGSWSGTKGVVPGDSGDTTSTTIGTTTTTIDTTTTTLGSGGSA